MDGVRKQPLSKSNDIVIHHRSKPTRIVTIHAAIVFASALRPIGFHDIEAERKIHGMQDHPDVFQIFRICCHLLQIDHVRALAIGGNYREQVERLEGWELESGASLSAQRLGKHDR